MRGTCGAAGPPVQALRMLYDQRARLRSWNTGAQRDVVKAKVVGGSAAVYGIGGAAEGQPHRDPGQYSRLPEHGGAKVVPSGVLGSVRDANTVPVPFGPEYRTGNCRKMRNPCETGRHVHDVTGTKHEVQHRRRARRTIKVAAAAACETTASEFGPKIIPQFGPGPLPLQPQPPL